VLRVPHPARARPPVGRGAECPPGEHSRPPRRGGCDVDDRSGGPYGRDGSNHVAGDRSARAEGLRAPRARPGRRPPGPAPHHGGWRARARGQIGARPGAGGTGARGTPSARSRSGAERPGTSRARGGRTHELAFRRSSFVVRRSPFAVNAERRTSNLERRTTNPERRTRNDERRTTNVERRTSNDTEGAMKWVLLIAGG